MMLPTNVPEGTPDWRTHCHADWFNVGSTTRQCPGCLLIVSDDEVRRFARSRNVIPESVQPGTVTAKRLGAPWARPCSDE